QIAHVSVEEGLIVSGDSFMDDAGRVACVTSKLPNILAADMEAAAIAQTCFQFQVPFVIIRSLSDIAGKDSKISFKKFLQTATVHASRVIQIMLKELNHDVRENERGEL